MLDAETKRRIDAARDILVGKVPDPKSQIEQITIALIYKFMDDMDAQSEELGGKRSFFTDEFEKYSWTKLIRGGLGGYDMLNLYAEAIQRMPENPGIPSLFQAIFSDAYLPYRDPQTLRLFLDEIDGFTYDHSERLGDAYEYLLSVMGSQGKAGQFRTPRHIIDFIVQIVDPKKDEQILDPACGTGGFLIAAYKHIFEANRDEDGNLSLTSDDETTLTKNIAGYDIDPGMVRLALANMYLHQIAKPRIDEYDTLTSEEKWDEYADVILANPPFMSPKGGIRPHNRFSVKSKRSEVLFVDYMAEHLTAEGRAGIIVPEGIIFQTQNAHKQLRKALIENSLVAVVSLPAGVFKPYSGVKTSILFLDKEAAKSRQHIAFFKVENDGFDLGDQRRPIDLNDLPDTAEALKEYLRRGAPNPNTQFSTGPVEEATLAAEGREAESKDLSSLIQKGNALFALKEKIAEDGEYNLSMERYRETRQTASSWPMARLSDICNIINEKPQPFKGEKPYYSTGAIVTDIKGEPAIVTYDNRPSRANIQPRLGDVGFAVMKNTSKVALIDDHYCGAIFSTGFCFLRPSERIISEYLYIIVKSDKFQEIKDNRAVDGIMGGIRKSAVGEIEIPLPTLDVQREIVGELEAYQRVIDGARAVLENYRPRVETDPTWPLVKLRDICAINPRKPKFKQPSHTEVSFVPMADINENQIGFIPQKHKTLQSVGTSYTYFENNDVLLARVTPCFENGKAGIARNLKNGMGFGSSEFHVLRSSDKSLPEWIYYSVIRPEFRQSGIRNMTGTGGLQRVPRKFVEDYRVSLPPLETQRAIVGEIEEERNLVDANRELMVRFEHKIKAAVSRVWMSR